MTPSSLITSAAVAALALAASYEAPRAFKAAELVDADQLKGPHHTIEPEVSTEGYFHTFRVASDYGAVEAEGKTMLQVRLHEVGALAELDKVSKSEVFVKAAGASVLNVGKGVASAVKDPGATVKGVGSGVKRFGTNLGRKGKRTADKAVDSTKDDDKDKDEKAEKSEDSKSASGVGVANSMLGVNSSARKWAQKVGADPYTTNPVLKKALTDIGQIDRAGGLAAKIAVPIPPVVSSTAKVGNLVWSQDPEALLKGNEQRLKELGAPDATIKKLYLSKGFSLSLHTRLAASLAEVKVPGCAEYVATAAEADTEREAVFFVESAEMLARFHSRAPVAAVLPDSRALVVKTKDGRAVVLLPVDWVSWTRAYDEALTEVGRRAKAEFQVSVLELRTTGTVSPLAKEQTAERGWKVVPDTL